MNTYEVRFTNQGYIVAVVFCDARNAADAIDHASMSVVFKYDDVTAKLA